MVPGTLFFFALGVAMGLIEERAAMVTNPLFGEQITYRPHEGLSRTIWAIVDRQRVELGQVGRTQYVIAVTRDPLGGVPCPTIGKDCVGVPLQRGDTALVTATVDEMITEDPGGYGLVVSL